MKDFEGYSRWTLRAPVILCADSLHDDGASLWAWDDDAEVLFKKFGPLHPSDFSLWRVNPLKGLGHRNEPFPNGMQGVSSYNHGRHIEELFQTEVIKTSPFKGPFGMKDFQVWLDIDAFMQIGDRQIHFKLKVILILCVFSGSDVWSK